MNERYHIRDRKAGNIITKTFSYYEAIDIVCEYINYDKSVGDYEKNYYEIYDTVNEEVVYIA